MVFLITGNYTKLKGIGSYCNTKNMFITIELSFALVLVNWVGKKMLKSIIRTLHKNLLFLNINLDLR
jgi:hypothetical protein